MPTDNNDAITSLQEEITFLKNQFRELEIKYLIASEKNIEAAVIKSNANFLRETYKTAFKDLNPFPIETAPRDGTEVMCITENLQFKKAKWLGNVNIEAWGNNTNDNETKAAYWTFSENDYVTHYIPIIKENVYKDFATAPKDGSKFIATMPSSNEYYILSWKVKFGQLWFWGEDNVANPLNLLEPNDWSGYVWCPIQIPASF